MEKIVNLMGGEIYYYINSSSNELEIIEYMISKTIELVNIFNFFDKNSYLSKLNKNKKIKYNKELAFLLEKSQEYYILSNKKFNPFQGNKIKKRKENLNNLNSKLEIVPIITITKEEIKISKDLKIDLGGIAKGYIIDRVLEKTLNEFKSKIKDILIDARGDIVTFGNSKKIIGIENPFNETSFEDTQLRSGSIITSGHNKQQFKGGSHILGTESDILTITLKSEKHKCYNLDALGTYLIQLDSQEVLTKIEFDKYYDEIECLVVLNNGKILRSCFW